MNSPDPDPGLAQDDRRARARISLDGGVEIRIQRTQLTARAENRSDSGMYLVLDEPLSVEVTVDGVAHAARLVRVSSLPGDRSGWGVDLRPADNEPAA